MFISPPHENSVSGNRPMNMKSGTGYTSCRFLPERDMYVLRRENNSRRRHAVSFSCLAKISSAGSSCMQRWKVYLNGLLHQIVKSGGISASPLVIGLAESGIIPSALFHQLLREKAVSASWICSTRRPAAGIPFTESHSHGPDHILPLPGRRPTELCFVEDEITTGQTLLRLSLRLSRQLKLRKIRFLAFTDHRNAADRELFQKRLKDENVDFSTHILSEPTEKERPLYPPSETLPADSGSGDRPDIRPGIISDTGTDMEKDSGTVKKASGHEKQWNYPQHRPALTDRSHIRIPFQKNIQGTLLALGEAVDMGLHIVQSHPALELRHITLSPWEVDGHHIQNRLDIMGEYYIYNYHTLRQPLHILHDPVDREMGMAAAKQLTALGFHTEILDA